MKSTLLTFNLSIASTVAILGAAGAAQAFILVPPDLNPGDQYRLVFITDGETNPGSTDIADYNAFVTGDVEGSLLEMELTDAGLTTDWFAIASTEAVDAIDNTSTTGTGVPIYLITGERIADDYLDLWDGSIQTQIDRTPSDGRPPDTTVLTGTGVNGTGGGSIGGPLGSFPFISLGLWPWDDAPLSTPDEWIDSGRTGSGSSLFAPMYAISEVL